MFKGRTFNNLNTGNNINTRNCGSSTTQDFLLVLTIAPQLKSWIGLDEEVVVEVRWVVEWTMQRELLTIVQQKKKRHLAVLVHQ